MRLIPRSIVQARWMEAIARIEHGRLTFVDPGGEVHVVTGPRAGPSARFEIRDWGVLDRLVARGDIGLGEDYIAGAWETDDVEALISLFLLNLDQLEGFAHGNLWNRIAFVLLNTLIRRNSESGSRRNIEAHYDVGNAFYSLWLDETMTYSSALYERQGVALGEAQRSKYRRILSKIDRARADVLEVGCGWGGFAEAAAETRHAVTGITISPAQHAFATTRLQGKADIRLEDYRKTKGLFDAIVSIEMFEAVGERYWPQYFDTLSQRLKRGGRAILQTITIRDDLFPLYRTRSDFIRQYVFPGGMLPSLGRVTHEAQRAGFKVVDVFAFGQDYARTLREWSARQRAVEPEIRKLGHDDRFLRNWQFYLGMCAAAFAVGRTNVVQVELAHA
ncbi:MAG: class I SAM-dependent methyltransferase [Alphaproteobacteria bacterium]|nr:class I SAM-dependent methyltransferase [Alphaproteobacteria bacterium]